MGDQTVGGKSARAAKAAPEHGAGGDAGDLRVRSGGAVDAGGGGGGRPMSSGGANRPGGEAGGWPVGSGSANRACGDAGDRSTADGPNAATRRGEACPTAARSTGGAGDGAAGSTCGSVSDYITAAESSVGAGGGAEGSTAAPLPGGGSGSGAAGAGGASVDAGRGDARTTADESSGGGGAARSTDAESSVGASSYASGATGGGAADYTAAVEPIVWKMKLAELASGEQRSADEQVAAPPAGQHETLPTRDRTSPVSSPVQVPWAAAGAQLAADIAAREIGPASSAVGGEAGEEIVADVLAPAAREVGPASRAAVGALHERIRHGERAISPVGNGGASSVAAEMVAKLLAPAACKAGNADIVGAADEWPSGGAVSASTANVGGATTRAEFVADVMASSTSEAGAGSIVGTAGKNQILSGVRAGPPGNKGGAPAGTELVADFLATTMVVDSKASTASAGGADRALVAAARLATAKESEYKAQGQVSAKTSCCILTTWSRGQEASSHPEQPRFEAAHSPLFAAVLIVQKSETEGEDADQAPSANAIADGTSTKHMNDNGISEAKGKDRKTLPAGGGVPPRASPDHLTDPRNKMRDAGAACISAEAKTIMSSPNAIFARPTLTDCLLVQPCMDTKSAFEEVANKAQDGNIPRCEPVIAEGGIDVVPVLNIIENEDAKAVAPNSPVAELDEGQGVFLDGPNLRMSQETTSTKTRASMSDKEINRSLRVTLSADDIMGTLSHAAMEAQHGFVSDDSDWTGGRTRVALDKAGNAHSAAQLHAATLCPSRENGQPLAPVDGGYTWREFVAVDLAAGAMSASPEGAGAADRAAAAPPTEAALKARHMQNCLGGRAAPTPVETDLPRALVDGDMGGTFQAVKTAHTARAAPAGPRGYCGNAGAAPTVICAASSMTKKSHLLASAAAAAPLVRSWHLPWAPGERRRFYDGCGDGRSTSSSSSDDGWASGGESTTVAKTAVARAAVVTTTASGHHGGATGRPAAGAADDSARAAATTARASAAAETVSGPNGAAGRPAAAAVAVSGPARMVTTTTRAAVTVPAAGQSGTAGRPEAAAANKLATMGTAVAQAVAAETAYTTTARIVAEATAPGHHEAVGRPAAAAANEAETAGKMAQAAVAITVPAVPCSTTGGNANDQSGGTGPMKDQTGGGKSARAGKAATEHGADGEAGDLRGSSDGAVDAGGGAGGRPGGSGGTNCAGDDSGDLRMRSGGAVDAGGGDVGGRSGYSVGAKSTSDGTSDLSVRSGGAVDAGGDAGGRPVHSGCSKSEGGVAGDLRVRSGGAGDAGDDAGVRPAGSDGAKCTSGEAVGTRVRSGGEPGSGRRWGLKQMVGVATDPVSRGGGACSGGTADADGDAGGRPVGSAGLSCVGREVVTTAALASAPAATAKVAAGQSETEAAAGGTGLTTAAAATAWPASVISATPVAEAGVGTHRHCSSLAARGRAREEGEYELAAQLRRRA